MVGKSGLNSEIVCQQLLPVMPAQAGIHLKQTWIPANNMPE